VKTLKDKVVVITGAASGIGQALALACAAKGARLMLADINEAGLAQTCEQARALGATCLSKHTDTASEAAIFELAEFCAARLGAAEVLVNNAGVALVSSVEKLQTADAQWLMAINFWGVVHGCRAFLPQMKTRPEAVIVNLSSIFAMISAPTQSMYNAAKAGVRAFSDSLRVELRNDNIGVLCVHPGGIKTNIVNRSRMTDLSIMQLSAQQMREQFEQNAPTTAQQAADAIVQAIESGRTRLLIGNDAKVADLIYRLFPARASAWISSMARKRRDALLAKQRA
jgi:NADP-dependent 3-hydroxy acid dehydrogenase YdfG